MIYWVLYEMFIDIRILNIMFYLSWIFDFG